MGQKIMACQKGQNITKELTPGTIIEVTGLQNRPEYNGYLGQLASFNECKEAWNVDLLHKQGEYTLKPKFLKRPRTCNLDAENANLKAENANLKAENAKLKAELQSQLQESQGAAQTI